MEHSNGNHKTERGGNHVFLSRQSINTSCIRFVLKVNESSTTISVSSSLTTGGSLYLSRSPLFTQSSAVEGKNMYTDLAIWYQGLSDDQMYEAFDIRPRKYT